MNKTTALAVIETLKDRKVEAYYEYPGYISMVPCGFSIHMNVAEDGDEISIQSCDEDGELLEVIESCLPSDCQDVQRIVDFLAFQYTAQEEILREAVAPYGLGQ